MKHWWLTLLCAVIALPSWADSAATEKRMLNIAAELRCLVCQNESIAASRADLAVDLRQQIREQIQAGKSDTEIRTYMVDRYGDFVLYRTPLKATTLLLWFGPMLLLAFGLLVLATTLRRRKNSVADASLSDDERKRAQALLAQTTDNGTSP
ncbi:cytochrome C biogenesis protein [Pusillimonas sp. T7-7]|jgi:cytochrome c-type biogenesis protein CcmH|uniref:cytochrome c-type biogenesis protein n=1 Tax=unclassified Pusillimonas TaxID=2640016 RepID=UPI0002084604|nr:MULTISPECIES: cytochrome c-type biogenesis protein [unclassified Pusillimonas]NYT58717.1 cytochrome c-type biogenesis protein CcmH [Alcaligenaceae bacterium]TKR56386.1 cytochrome c-type biogenesis protein CcmH [Allopusillimonas ginsengisoli]HCN72435.1 cytochrome c-type biogenesis protein CcmH [Pusillimonas sp.]AEC20376.1 cytochrome C biogenesis protein [Pusillimonas sp. T7-7]MCC2597742.1 cytochrome c-type biogenesis protein CcmH [Pusillimonas sp. MFBS29]|tara:strand:- start:40819 stop:41274 length:456 start_codon:yes stop_codon:yes gene_type:complete